MNDTLRPGFDFSAGGMILISRTEFPHLGVQVTELIVTHKDSPDTRKILWALSPFEQMLVNGVENPRVHTDYTAPFEDLLPLEMARRKVQEKFDEYHNLRDPQRRMYNVVEG